MLLVFIMQKNTPPSAQNGLLVVESPKQGLVGGCPAPLHSCQVKGEFYNDRQAFIQHFIQKEEPLVLRVIRHYAISAALLMRSPFSFGFQSNRVFTRTLNRIRKGIKDPVQSD